MSGMTKREWIVLFLLLGLVGIRTAWAQSSGEQVVAILPTVNSSGEKDEKQRERQRIKGDETLSKEFADRGLRLADSDVVRKVLSDLKVDLSDEEQQKRASLFEVGKAVHADLVVFAVITHVSQQLHTNVLSSSREGKAQVKLWLLDVAHEKPILSASVKEGKSGGGFFAGLDKGSDRIVIAVGNAIRDHLKEFFKPYSLKDRKK